MQRLQQELKALGSQAYLTLVAEDGYDLEVTFAALEAQIVAFEQRFSRFLPDSELTAFNTAAGKQTPISPAFRDVLLACQKMAELTGGLYNPFILPALQAAGYRGSWPSMDKLAGAKDFSARHVVGAQALQIGENSAYIPAETALDFGGIGKGYLLDQLSAYLQPLPVAGYWLSLGGDVVCAGRDLADKNWAVGVADALNPEATLATLTNQTDKPLYIATSGITKRQGDGPQGPWHHLINPATGKPANTDILTATVTAASGTKADVYAKTIIIAGSSQAQALQQAGEIYSYVLQVNDKEPIIQL